MFFSLSIDGSKSFGVGETILVAASAFKHVFNTWGYLLPGRMSCLWWFLVSATPVQGPNWQPCTLEKYLKTAAPWRALSQKKRKISLLVLESADFFIFQCFWAVFGLGWISFTKIMKIMFFGVFLDCNFVQFRALSCVSCGLWWPCLFNGARSFFRKLLAGYSRKSLAESRQFCFKHWFQEAQYQIVQIAQFRAFRASRAISCNFVRFRARSLVHVWWATIYQKEQIQRFFSKSSGGGSFWPFFVQSRLSWLVAAIAFAQCRSFPFWAFGLKLQSKRLSYQSKVFSASGLFTKSGFAQALFFHVLLGYQGILLFHSLAPHLCQRWF